MLIRLFVVRWITSLEMDWVDILFMLGILVFFILVFGGFFGNALSAIVWLRIQVSVKSSSAVYLAAIAINDLIHVLSYFIFPFLSCETLTDGLACSFATFTHLSSYSLEPLLVLGFSLERLFAIYRPLQVRLYMFIYLFAQLYRMSMHIIFWL